MRIKAFNNTKVAMLLVLSILFTMLAPAAVNAASGSPATEIYYGGQKLDKDTPYLLVPSVETKDPVPLASSSETAEGYVLLAVFDAQKGTLAFKKGYNPTTPDGAAESGLLWNSNVVMAAAGDDNTTMYGIKANGDLTIDLATYHNSLFINWNNGIKDVNVRGIYADGDLTIKGTTGSMRITGSAPNDTTPDDNDAPLMNYAICATGDVNLLGGEIYIYDRPYNSVHSGDGSVFINADGDINLDGATLKIRARKGTAYAKNSNKDMNIADNYTEVDSSHLELDHGNKGNGFTVDKGADYGNTCNLTLVPGEGGNEEEGDGDADIIVDDESTLPKPEARPDATELYYCGVKLDAETPYLLLTDDSTKAPVPLAASTESVSGYKLIAEFDAKKGVLTYKGGFDSALSWNTQVDMKQLEEGGVYYGIKANGNLVIDLGKYNNHLYLGWRYPQGAPLYAIDVDGKLTVKGTKGILKMTATPVLNSPAGTPVKSYGIRAYGDIRLEGGTILIYEGHYTPDSINDGSTSTYIGARGGDIYIDGADVKLRARKSTKGIIHFGREPIVSEGYTESSSADVEISDSVGTEIATTDNKNNLTLIAPAKESGDTVIDGPSTELYYCGVKLNEKTPYLLIDASSRVLKGSSRKSEDGYTLYAIFESGKLIYQHGFAEELLWNTQVEMVQCEDDDIYRGIKANGDLIIDLGSYHNFLFLNWRYPQGAPLYAIETGGDLTIRGTTGSLKMCATPTLNSAVGTTYNSYGIKAGGDVYLNSGTVYVYEGHYTPDKINAGSTTTYIGAAGNIYIDGAKVKMRARKSSTGIIHFDKEPIMAEGYVKTTDENVEISDSIGTELATSGNKNNLTLTPPEKLKLIVGGAMLDKDKPYLVKNGDGWAESDTDTDAYGVYDYENDIFTFTKSAKIGASMNVLAGENKDSKMYTYSSILSDLDIEIVIPKNVNVTLNAENSTGIARAIWGAGDVKISGRGTLDAYAGPSKKDGNYLSGAIWAKGKVTIGGVKAVLHTVKGESNGKSGHVIYADAIEFADGATVYAGTDKGKLFNVAPTVYGASVAKMADASTGDYNQPTPESALITYDASRITEMKYMQVEPEKMVATSIGGYGENGKISASEPVIEYVFNYEIASGVTADNVTVSGGATVENVVADKNVLRVLLGNVSAGKKYTVGVSGIENSIGAVFSSSKAFEVSGLGVSVILNGSAGGEVLNDNTVEVAVSTSGTENVMVIVTVWKNGTYAKKLVSAKSVTESINGSGTITVSGIEASDGEFIEVMVWDGATRKVLRKSVKFGR